MKLFFLNLFVRNIVILKCSSEVCSTNMTSQCIWLIIALFAKLMHEGDENIKNRIVYAPVYKHNMFNGVAVRRAKPITHVQIHWKRARLNPPIYLFITHKVACSGYLWLWVFSKYSASKTRSVLYLIWRLINFNVLICISFDRFLKMYSNT